VIDMLLVIVPRKDSSLQEYLTMRFAGVTAIQILLDRRQGERRRERRPIDVERRRSGERRHQRRDAQAFGVTLVRVRSDAGGSGTL
jgi:hypothetical protein